MNLKEFMEKLQSIGCIDSYRKGSAIKYTSKNFEIIELGLQCSEGYLGSKTYVTCHKVDHFDIKFEEVIFEANTNADNYKEIFKLFDEKYGDNAENPIAFSIKIKGIDDPFDM